MASTFQMGTCRCPACRSRALLGPIVLITLGVLLMLQMTTWRYSLRETWPVLLVVVGVVKLLQRLMPNTGHRDITDLSPSRPAGTGSGH